MGGGASINSLSAEDLGQYTAKIGQNFKVYKDKIVKNGISGNILLHYVKGGEVDFISFVSKNLGVTDDLHQTVLYRNYVEALNNGGGGVAPDVAFDIRETVQRPPKDILVELFKTQVPNGCYPHSLQCWLQQI